MIFKLNNFLLFKKNNIFKIIKSFFTKIFSIYQFDRLKFKIKKKTFRKNLQKFY